MMTERSTHTLPSMSLSLLGNPFLVLENGERLFLQVDNPVLLLAYLALHSKKVHLRGDLAVLFYPDSDDDKANQNIRQVIHRLRKLIGDDNREVPILLVDQVSIRVNPDANILIDTGEVTRLAADAQHSFRQHGHRRLDICKSCAEIAVNITGHFQGEFLDGTFPHTGGLLDDWVLKIRNEYHAIHLRYLHHLAIYYYAIQENARCQEVLETILGVEPMDELALRKMMILLSSNGQSSQALSRYHGFQKYLQKVINDGVEEETMLLAHEIRARAANGNQNQVRQTYHQYLGSISTHLPDQSIPFFGREAEIGQIEELLGMVEHQIITVRGVIGSGKTRLALQIANSEAALWQDGVTFIATDRERAQQILLVAILVEAFGIDSQNFVDHRAKLIDHLKNKEALIIIDDIDYFAEYQSVISAICFNCPRVKFLLTTRKHLSLRGDKSVIIQGLNNPQLGAAAQDGSQVVSQSPALQMLEFVAKRANADFELTDQNRADFSQVCELLSNLPAGIELVGSYARLFTSEEIRDGVVGFLNGASGVFAFISLRHDDFKNRFQYIWNTLTDAEKELVRLVSAYPEGVVTDDLLAKNLTTIETLVTLQDNSTLLRLPGSRVKIHPLVHFFF